MTFLDILGQTAANAEMMNGLDNSVEQLTESTIALAEATANFGALKVIFGVFMAFMFVIMVFFVFQLLTSQKKIGDIYKISKGVDKYFREENNRTIGYAQAYVLIGRAFVSLTTCIKYNIVRTRLENHLDQKELITNKVTRTISYEWGELMSFLNNFEYKDAPLARVIDENDCQLIINFMLEQIYMDKSIYSLSTMDQAAELLMNGIKQVVLNEIHE